MPLEQALKDFEALRAPVTDVELTRLGRRIRTHVDAIAEAALSEPELPVGLAEILAGNIATLIAASGSFDDEQRGIVYAAAKYFILTCDADNDLISAHGLADDVYVFNEACRLLGRDDLTVTS